MSPRVPSCFRVATSTMLHRPATMIALLGASLSVPYVVSQTTGDEEPATNSEQAESPNPALALRPTRQPLGPNSLIYQNPVPLEGKRFHSLAEVLRWDITKQWVYQRWARKSTGLADLDSFGVRVPLVTGTGVGDLAGSLSYYFDRAGRLQHISFRGRTGNTTHLVQLLVQRFGFERQANASPGEQLFQVRKRGQLQSQLRTRPEAVLWSTSPHTSFRVELDLERPDSNRFMNETPPMLQIPQVAASSPPPESVPQEAESQVESDEPEGPKTQLDVKVRQRRWPG